MLNAVQMVLDMSDYWYGTQPFKWSMKMIFFVQIAEVIVGNIGQALRSLMYVGNYSLNAKYFQNHFSVFRVDKEYIQQSKGANVATLG